VRVGVSRAYARRVRTVGAVVAVGLAVAAAAPSVQATFPGRNGRIAFMAIHFSAEFCCDSTQIVSIRPDGRAPRLLARDPAEHPSYRPDGHMIAFARPRQGIFLMRSGGSAKRRLLSGPYGEPDWAPDGRRLVVTRTRRPRGIFIWNRGELRVLTSGYAPAWSPTGRLIAFNRDDLPQPGGVVFSSVYVMGSDGCCVRRLGPGSAPEWSPDGRRLLFERNDRTIRSIRPNGTGLRRVAPIRRAFNPVYSPNGRLITYSKELPGVYALPDDVVWTMRADGSRRTRIFNLNNDLPWGARDGVFDLDWQPRPRPRP
jgi:Tol biopolymer transport system component